METINKIITEPYKHSGKLKAQIKSGFATVSQKSTLVKLKVLFDAVIVLGSEHYEVKKGSMVIISEEILHTAPWAKQSLTMDGFSGEFIVVDPVYIIGVSK